MNLIEAVQSGRPFRRGAGHAYHTDPIDLGPLDFEDITSTDWELKPEPREGELCATCWDSKRQGAHASYGFWIESHCRPKGHTPFKWREVEGE